MRHRALAALLAGVGLSAAWAKDPCPGLTPEEVRACEALARRPFLPLGEGPGRVGMDAHFVYVFRRGGEGQPDRLERVPRAGGMAVVLASDVRSPDLNVLGPPVVVSGGRVYWAADNALFSVSAEGGAVETLAEASDDERAFSELTADDRFLYGDPGAPPHALVRMAQPRGKPQRIGSRPSAHDHLVDAGGYLAWTLPASGHPPFVVTLDKRTQSELATPVPRADNEIWTLGSDGRALFIGTFFGLFRMPLPRGPMTRLSPTGVETLVVGQSNVFFVPWAGNCGGGHLSEVPKAGGAVRERTACPDTRNFLPREGKLFFVGPGGLHVLDE